MLWHPSGGQIRYSCVRYIAVSTAEVDLYGTCWPITIPMPEQKHCCPEIATERLLMCTVYRLGPRGCQYQEILAAYESLKATIASCSP